MSSKELSEKLEVVRQLGRDEAYQMRNEAIDDGYYVQGQSRDWDGGLINALGGKAVAEIFECELDSPEFAACCSAYSEAAIDAWDEVRE